MVDVAKCQVCNYRLGYKKPEGIQVNRTNITVALPATLVCPRCKKVTRFAHAGLSTPAPVG